jgi:hypothetical protein
MAAQQADDAALQRQTRRLHAGLFEADVEGLAQIKL